VESISMTIVRSMALLCRDMGRCNAQQRNNNEPDHVDHKSRSLIMTTNA
jgi:hypothetical protein